MQRRQVLAAAGALGAGAASGCSDILGCGPGDDEIGDIADGQDEYGDGEVAVEGEVTDMEEDGMYLVIDDGTGTAKLMAPFNYVYDPELVGEGDCHSDRGTVESWDDDDADVVIGTVPPEQ